MGGVMAQTMAFCVPSVGKTVASVAPTKTRYAEQMPKQQERFITSARRPPVGPRAASTIPVYEESWSARDGSCFWRARLAFMR